MSIAPPRTLHPSVFVGVEPDGTVMIVAHRSEMGTGSRTALPMVVADELEADWKRVQHRAGASAIAKYGDQDTDGSHSIRNFFDVMREAGATARTDADAGRGRAVERSARPNARPSLHAVIHRRPAASSAMASWPPPPSKLPVPRKESAAVQDQERSGATSARTHADLRSGRHRARAKPVFGMDAQRGRHGLRVDRASAGAGRQGEIARRQARR